MIFTPACDEVVGDRLGGGGRDGEHADDDVLVLDHRHELGAVAHGRRADDLPDLALVVVEDRDDAEAVVGEDVRRGDRLPEMAGAEQRDVVLARGPQDLADLRHERVDVVADAALAELPEAGEVAADLRRVDVRVVAELAGGDRLLAHLLGLREDLEVARQARRHAEREALAPADRTIPRKRGVRRGYHALAGRHRRFTLSRRSRRAGSSTKKSNRSSPSSATTGMRSR